MNSKKTQSSASSAGTSAKQAKTKLAGKSSAARLVSLLLAIVLVVTMVPALAFAGGDEQPMAPVTEETTGTEGAGTEGEGAGEDATTTEEEPVVEEELLDATEDEAALLGGLAPLGGELSPLAAGDITTTIASGGGAFRTYTDQAAQKNTPIGELSLGLSINMTKADLSGGTIEIPLNYTLAAAAANTANQAKGYAFEYGTDGTNGVSSGNAAPDFFNYSGFVDASSIVTKVDTTTKPGYAVITLANNKPSGTYGITLNFSFTPAYDGMIPDEAVLWTIAPVTYLGGTEVHTTTAATVTASAPIGIHHEMTERMSPSDGKYSEGNITARFDYRNYGYYANWFDDTYDNIFYIEVPKGFTINTATAQYYNKSIVLPDGSTRYYRSVIDTSNANGDYSYWWGTTHTEPRTTMHQETYTIIPSSELTKGQEFKIYYGTEVKRANGEIQTTRGALDYVVQDKEDWAIATSNYHSTGNSQYSIVVNEPGNYQDARYPLRVATMGSYGREGAFYNAGKTNIEGVALTLYQASTDSGKLNFSSLYVAATKQSGTTALTNFYRVDFEIKNAQGGATRPVSSAVTQGDFHVTLPTLGAGEYINKLILVPMGDGTQEGVLLPSNGVGFNYYAGAWGADTWPDGTAIPEYTEVPMAYTIDYYDELAKDDKTAQGNTFTHYYTSSAYVYAGVSSTSTDATTAQPGDIVNYTIHGTNYEYYSAGDWVEPYIALRVSKYMTYVGPTTTTLTDMGGQTYDVYVTQTGSDANYNYYGFQAEDGYAAGWNGTGSTFSIDAKFKVAEGTPEKLYSGVIRADFSTKNHSEYRSIRNTVNSGGTATAIKYGFSQSTDGFSSSGASSHTQLNVLPATNAAGSSLVSGDSTGGAWVDSSLVAATKNSEVKTRLVIENTGNTTMSGIKLYNILPADQDSRGSTGAITFEGVENLTGATVYYWIGAGAPPAYAANLDIQGMKPADNPANWTASPTAQQIKDAKAIYIDFGAAVLQGAQNLTGDLVFKIPDANNQVAVNEFMFSSTVGGEPQNYTSSIVTFSTEIVNLAFDGNKPTTAAPLATVENIPAAQTKTLGDPGVTDFDISATAPSLDYYTFVEWNTAANGSGTSYNPGETFPLGDAAANHTLYAIWQVNSASVTYTNNDNGVATGVNTAFDTTALSVYTHSDLPYTLPAPSARSGMEFVGWTGTGITGDAVMTHTVPAGTTGNLAFVANWKSIKTYEVKHWIVKHDNTIELYETQSPEPTGLVGDTKTASSLTIDGYTYNATFDNGAEKTVASGTIPATGKLVLNLYYEANSGIAYTVNHYKVDYEGNVTLHSTETPEPTGTVGATVSATPLTTITGHTYSASFDDGTNKSVASGIIPATGKLTLNLYYPATTYKITYEYAAGAKPASAASYLPAETNAAYGSPQARSATPALDQVVDGYTFNGWQVSGATLDASGNFTMPAGNVTFTGSWTVNTNNVTYRWTTDSQLPANVDLLKPTGALDVAFGTPMTVSSTPTTNQVEGYTFHGWVPTIASGITLSGNTFTMPDNAVVFEGKWTLNTYKITYVYSGGKPTGADAHLPLEQTVNYNSAQTRDANLEAGDVVAGYTFNGWATSDVSVDATTGAFTMPANNVTFTGTWSLNSHKITYEYSGTTPVDADTVLPLEKTAFYDTAQAMDTTLKAGDELNGYTFGGWTTSDANVNPTTGAFTMPDNAVTFVGTWSANPYNVTYLGNGATGGTTASQIIYYDESFTAAQNGFTRAGYTFANWNTVATPTASNPGIMYTAGQVTPQWKLTNDLTLYAQWDPNTGTAYRVEHYLVGTSGTPVLNYTENRTGTTDTQAYASPRAYTGYTYNSSYAGTVASGNINGNGTLVLKLYYQINYYTVNFLDWNGSMLASRSVAYGNSALAPVDPTRLGHTFTGWDRGYTNITSNITVNATYTPLTFTVTFMGYNDTVLQTSTVEYGGGTTPPANPTRSGYTFDGWDKPSSTWTNVTADATVRATWEERTTPGTTSTVTPGSNDTTTTTTTNTPSPTFTIPGTDVPLFGAEGTWALFNLISALAGIVVFVVALVLSIMRRKRVDQETGHDNGYSRTEGMWVDENGDIVDERKEGKRHVRVPFVVVSMIATVAMVVLFILTQDMTLNMALFDIWTIAFAILLVVSIVTAILAFKRVKVADDEEQAAPEAV